MRGRWLLWLPHPLWTVAEVCAAYTGNGSVDHGWVAMVGGGTGGSISLHSFSLFRNDLFNFSFKSRHC